MRLIIDHVSLIIDYYSTFAHCCVLKPILSLLPLFLVPTVTQIKNFFRQPNIYSTIAALNVTNITLEDRCV